MSTSSTPIRVELHGFLPGEEAKGIRSDLKAARDVTPFVTSVQFQSGVAAPWETITVRMDIPLEQLSNVIPGRVYLDNGKHKRRQPETGFWVVLRTRAKGPALAWGRCISIGTGLKVDAEGGNIRSTPVILSCESWFSTVHKSRIVLGVAGYWAIPGFVWLYTGWITSIKGVLATLLKNTPGPSLNKLWQSLANMRIPSSLVTTATYGEQIPLVFDRETMETFAPMRAPQHIDVPGHAINALSSILPAGTLGEWLSASFAGPAELIEFFPSLEHPHSNYKENTDLTAIGDALGGAQPVLVYRIKPHLHAPISKARVQAFIDQDQKLTGVKKTSFKPDSETVGLWQTPSVQKVDVDWYYFPADEVRSISLQWSDGDRVNMTYARTPMNPGSQFELRGAFGTPIVDKGEILKHGLRARDIHWPFFPTVKTPTIKTEAIARRHVDAIAELAWAFTSDGSTRARGIVETLYKPWIKAGYWVFITLPVGELTGYVENVRHSVEVNGDNVSARTELQLSRMLLRESSKFIQPYFNSPDHTQRQSQPTRTRAGPLPKTITPASEKAARAKDKKDGPTEHFTWFELDRYGDRGTLPGSEENLMALALALEEIRLTANVPISITFHGGLNGKKMDAYRLLHGYVEVGVVEYKRDPIGVFLIGKDGKKIRKPEIRKKTSRHREGTAADLRPKGMTAAALHTIILGLILDGTIPDGGVGLYDTFVHYDQRTKPARWDEHTKGADE